MCFFKDVLALSQKKELTLQLENGHAYDKEHNK